MSGLRVRGDAPGPTLVLVAGIHGNEPAGVEACRRLMERLRDRPPARGEVAAFTGNPPALAAGRRYLARDLNRQWTAEALAAARADRCDAEMMALAQLADGLDDALARARGPVFALDLHTTSADGVPFAIAGDGEAHRAFAETLVVPAITGLAALTPGTLTTHLARRGCTSVAVEGGRHATPATLENLEAVLRLALAATGIADADEPGDAEARAHLQRARGALPPVIEVVSRHAIAPGSGFRMEPGFINIQRTAKGTLLARENGAEILAPFDGFLLLPLYQAQGSDGFFYGR